jgi:branched-chain amino acid transport system substrate-binding protein
MKKIWIGLVAVVLLVGLGYFFLSKKDTKEETVKIGAVLPLTGDLAFLGQPGQNALMLAQEKINSNGGVLNKKLDIKYYDSQGESKNAVTVVNKAISMDKQKILFTTLTNVALSVKEIASNNNLLQIIIAIAPDIAIGGKYSIQMCYSAKQEADEINKLIKNADIKAIGIISSKDAASDVELETYIIPFLKEHNINYYVEKFDVGQKDYKAIVTNMSKWETSNIIMLGYGSDFPNILREIHSLQKKDFHIWGGIGFAEIPSNTPKDLLNNITFVAPRVIQEQNSSNFFDEYKTKYNAEYVPYDAAYTYDAMIILANVINTIQTDEPSTVYNVLTNNYQYEGVTGILNIQGKEIQTTVAVCEFKEGISVIKE